MWGKLSQKNSQVETAYYNSSEEFFDRMSNANTVVQSVFFVTKETIGVTFTKQQDAVHPVTNQALVHSIMCASKLNLENYSGNILGIKLLPFLRLRETAPVRTDSLV